MPLALSPSLPGGHSRTDGFQDVLKACPNRIVYENRKETRL